MAHHQEFDHTEGYDDGHFSLAVSVEHNGGNERIYFSRFYI